MKRLKLLSNKLKTLLFAANMMVSRWLNVYEGIFMFGLRLNYHQSDTANTDSETLPTFNFENVTGERVNVVVDAWVV